VARLACLAGEGAASGRQLVSLLIERIGSLVHIGRGLLLHLVELLPAVVIPSGALAVKPRRIGAVQRIIADIGIQVEVIPVTHRIRLHEPPEARMVEPRLVTLGACPSCGITV